jgi:predicted  nucleic acid-binding Zn-ribbon protein
MHRLAVALCYISVSAALFVRAPLVRSRASAGSIRMPSSRERLPRERPRALRRAGKQLADAVRFRAGGDGAVLAHAGLLGGVRKVSTWAVVLWLAYKVYLKTLPEQLPNHSVQGIQVDSKDSSADVISKMKKAATEEELEAVANQHALECGKCGYVLFVASGRSHMLGLVKDGCPSCGAPKDEFIDLLRDEPLSAQSSVAEPEAATEVPQDNDGQQILEAEDDEDAALARRRARRRAREAEQQLVEQTREMGEVRGGEDVGESEIITNSAEQPAEGASRPRIQEHNDANTSALSESTVTELASFPSTDNERDQGDTEAADGDGGGDDEAEEELVAASFADVAPPPSSSPVDDIFAEFDALSSCYDR